MASSNDDDGGAIVPITTPPEADTPTKQLSAPVTREADTMDDNPLAPSYTVSVPENTLQRASTVPEKPKAGRGWIASAGPVPEGDALQRSVTGAADGGGRRNFQYPFQDEDSDSSTSSDEEWASIKRPSIAEVKKGKEATNKNKPLDTKGTGKKISSNPCYSKFSIGNDFFHTKGRVTRKDGRLKISVKESVGSGYLANTLGASIQTQMAAGQLQSSDEKGAREEGWYDTMAEEFFKDRRSRPRLNIVIIVIGSRGDIQPFIKVARVLKEDYGHRVRIATHPVFRETIGSEFEFFSVGGDPSELMAFMVKNPGLIPSLDTVKTGEVGRRRAAMYEMFNGMWHACIDTTDDTTDKANMNMIGDKEPFIADAIIANPPSMAHIHIAERLGIPLHMMFTFPYTPTQQFSHPLANIKQSNVDRNYTNFMSYPLVEHMTWQGLGDLINRFRVKSLGLDPVSTIWAPGQLYRLKVPYTYMWSPALVPKPKDWGPEVDIAGFVFLEGASSFKPSAELTKFLEAGEAPVYIGFGSIVVDDPNSLTRLIFEAVKMSGVRALVSKGWGGLGGDSLDVPENIFLLGNTPHDWLFPRCSAVVHHGGAGTTAIGLRCARPTMIVPFFGDQPFWGNMVADARAGAFKCIPYKKLTAEKFAEGIKQCLTDEAKINVQKISNSIIDEGDGAVNAVKSFHRRLTLIGEKSMRCSILENRVAVWRLKHTSLRLSAVAADILVSKDQLKWSNLELIRHREWNDFDGPGEPFTGGGTALFQTVTDIGKGIVLVPIRARRTIKKRVQHQKKKKKWDERNKRVALENEKLQNGSGDVGHEAPAEIIGRESIEPSTTENHGNLLEVPHDKTNGLSGLTRETTNLSTLSAEPTETVFHELAGGTGASLKKTGVAIAKAPMVLSLAVAQGFHNAPKLYGDTTVRTPRRIEGFSSGLRAARDEFVYGVADGFSGVVRLPIKGAKENGFVGALSGVGMGLGGLVLKNLSGILSPFAYATKGIQMEVHKKSQPTALIRRARIVQGGKEVRALREAAAKETKARKSTSKPIDKGKFDIPQRSDTASSTTTGSKRHHNPQPESFRDMEARVEEIWQIVCEVREMLNANIKKNGKSLVRSIQFQRRKKKWRDNGAFESMHTVRRALQAEKEGKDVTDELAKLKQELAASRRQRASDKGWKRRLSERQNSTATADSGPSRIMSKIVESPIEEHPPSVTGGAPVENVDAVFNSDEKVKAVPVGRRASDPAVVDFAVGR